MDPEVPRVDRELRVDPVEGHAQVHAVAVELAVVVSVRIDDRRRGRTLLRVASCFARGFGTDTGR